MAAAHEPTDVSSYARQGMRCGKCNEPFFYDMLVNAPMDKAIASMRAARCPKCGSSKLLLGLGLSLSEDRARRGSSPALHLRYEDWLENGDVGNSSRAVAEFMLKRLPPSAAPHDYDDLRRVILLLDRFPLWACHMHRLSEYPGWEKIAPSWTQIVDAVLEADPEARRPAAAQELLEDLFR